MKRILKTKKFSIAIIIAVITFFGFIWQGCQQEYENIDDDPEIMTSIELEDYIIAASDLYQSLMKFEDEIASIDFSNLETVIENGRKVTYLPNSVRSLNIEKKTLLLNQKKEYLLNKYPQVGLHDLNNFSRIVNQCVAQSARVNDSFFVDNDFYLPRLKTVTAEYSFDSLNSLVGFLYNWILSPDYVEVAIYFFTDGSNLVTIDSDNTATSATIRMVEIAGMLFYQGKKISKIAHTHSDSQKASPEDIEFKNKYDSIEHSIYYNGAFHNY